MKRTLAAACVLALAATVAGAGEELRCGVCGGEIAGKYILMVKEGKSVPVCAACAEKIRAQLPKCALCGAQISGKALCVTRDGQTFYYCENCVKTCPKCQTCGVPVARGEEYCETCLKTLAKCVLCGKPVGKGGIKFERGEAYCAKCAQLPTCSVCHHPVAAGAGVDAEGRIFCRECAARAKLCACCGKMIQGKYFQHPFTDGVFCEQCETERPKCRTCGRPIAGEPALVGGKRQMCADCFATVVIGDDRIQAIFAESKTLLQELLGEEVKHHLPLEMVDDIGAVRKESGFGSDGNELGLFKRTGEEYHIYVLYGLTEAMAFETVPHEWTHAWFAEHGNPAHAAWVQEGFCQWVASKVLEKKGYARTLRILQNRQDLYGAGYRYIKGLEEKLGKKSAVLEYMKQSPPSTESAAPSATELAAPPAE